jgi:hypothetical protein
MEFAGLKNLGEVHNADLANSFDLGLSKPPQKRPRSTVSDDTMEKWFRMKPPRPQRIVIENKDFLDESK